MEQKYKVGQKVNHNDIPATRVITKIDKKGIHWENKKSKKSGVCGKGTMDSWKSRIPRSR